LNTQDAVLAQNKLLTQQVEALTKQMTKLPQQLQAIQIALPGSYQNIPVVCEDVEEVMWLETVPSRM